MKKQVLSIAFTVFGLATLFAQNAEKNTAAAVLSEEGYDLPQQKTKMHFVNGPETPIWSEDFSGGIPTGWTNNGYDAFGNNLDSALWEYRGAATTPSVTTGSRGAWVGTRGPIVSPTASNGFLIFDSDYLDNNGVQGARGTGKAPAPHKGVLTSSAINLTGFPYVELKFNSYHRYFEGRTLVLFSTDGGLSFGDTLAAHPALAVNATSPSNGTVSFNVSSIIGNQGNVKIRFLFDGTYDDPGASGSGAAYYFWMIDDIEINEVQKHALRFTEWNDAPAQDIIFGPSGSGTSKMGTTTKFMSCDWTKDVTFDANAYNYGFAPLNNVKLGVDILDKNNLLISSYVSTASVNLNSGDTANYNTLNTYANPFKPNAVGTYKFVYKILSDSASVVSDTFNLYVSDSLLSNDFKYFHNSLGTNNLGNDGSAIGTRIDLDPSLQTTWLYSVQIGLSTSTIAGGVVEVEVYDTTGFDYIAGFPASNLVGASNSHAITAQNIANGYFSVPVLDATSNYVDLNLGSYFIVVRMYSNNGTNPIFIRNDQMFAQVGFGKIMYNTTDARWYSGYSNSRTLNAPHIRAVITCPPGNVNEDALRKHVSISPNPTTDFVHVNFTDYTAHITLTLTDLMGREILKQELNAYGGLKHPIDLQNLPSATYLLQVNNGQSVITYKVLKQ